jgi:hypothetical protein
MIKIVGNTPERPLAYKTIHQLENDLECLKIDMMHTGDPEGEEYRINQIFDELAHRSHV